MSDNNPKALTFGGVEHNAPLADISHLSDYEKANLKSKALGAFGTYDYEQFKSDEDFELALACLAPYYWGDHKVTDEDVAEYAAYHRGFYYHKKKYRVWEKEVLEPMVKRLTDYALDAPQFDASFLLELERRKMECMDAYFAHSVTADADGNYPGGRWLRLCIKLLGYLTGHIPEDKILGMNIRNVGYPISDHDLERFKTESDKDMKICIGNDIYWHKAHRLYCHIRQHALHTWWD